MENIFQNWGFLCVSIGTSSSGEIFNEYEGGFVNENCWVGMLYREKEK